MPNYRTNPNYGRQPSYARTMDTAYNRPQHHPTVMPEHHPTVMPEIQPDEELSQLPLAMAYVPMQKWETPFEMSDGLNKGTIFPGLYKPFLGGKCGYDAKNRY